MDKNYHTYMKVKDIVHPNLNTEDLYKVKNYCEKNQILFVDDEFPPEQQSLYGNPRHADYKGQWDTIEWARADQIFGEDNYQLFRGISPDDIKQGQLGDCYFLCSLASLAEYPDLIRRLFDFDEVNEQGVQVVWLNINGVWQRFILDEYFPVKGNTNRLAFTKTDQNELWVLLLEKAYAKAYGSYWDIVGGDPVHALRDLTGAPYDRIENFDDLDSVWSQLKEANAKQFMLTCFTHSTQITEEQSDEGLVSGHAYTILDVRNIIDSRGQPRRVVQIRNPWGKFEWTGEFSDDSDLWSPEDRQELNIQRSNDGIFWMPLETFVKYFQGVGILEILPGAVTNGIAVQQTNSNKSMLRMSLHKETNITISVDQTDSRLVDNKAYSYSYFRVTVGKLEGNKGVKFVDSLLSPERNVFLENTLPAGDYLILVEAYWDQNLVRQFNVGTYADQNVELELMNGSEALYDKTEYELWKQFGRLNYEKMDFKDKRIASNGRYQAEISKYQFQNKRFASIIYNYVNHDNQNSVHSHMQFTRLKGFDLVGQQANSNGAELVINPQDNDVLVLKMDPRCKEGFQCSHRIIDEEVIPYKFADDRRNLEYLNALGGMQPVPGQKPPAMQSRMDKKKQVQERMEKQRQIDIERERKRQQRLQIVQEEKRRLEESKRRQMQKLQKRGNFDSVSFGNFFGDLSWQPLAFGGLSGQRGLSGILQNIGLGGMGMMNMMGGGGMGGLGNMMGGNRGMGGLGNMMGQGMNMMSGRNRGMGGLGNLMGQGMNMMGQGNRGMGGLGNMMGQGMNMMGGGRSGMGGLGNMGRMMVSPSQQSCNIF